MSRNLSTLTRNAMYRGETEEAFLILMTFSHDDLVEPIRVSSDAVNTMSRSETFISFPFELSLPDDEDNRSPRAHLVIDNVDRQIVQAIRSLRTSPTLLIEVIRAADPDVVEAQFADFKLTNVFYDMHVVEGDLTIEDFTTEPFPANVFSPSLFPGMF